MGPWAIRFDLLSARILVWIASAGKRGELRPEVNVFLYDRYWRLARYHRAKNNPRRARRLMHKAEKHWRLSGSDGPPFAAAMSMPIPRPGPRTWSVAGRDDPEDAA